MEYTHVITDAVTGEVTVIPFTEEEILIHLANQVEEAKEDPIQKLTKFLADNPDVAQFLNTN
jgi:hypothetical protein